MAARKFVNHLAWADNSWTPAEFSTRVASVVDQIPEEYRHTVRVELVLSDGGEFGCAAFIAVTAVMTSSFDYTDSDWSPA